MLPRFAQSAYRFTSLDSPPLGSLSAAPKKGTVEAKASTALFRLPIIPPQIAYTGSLMDEDYARGFAPCTPSLP